MNTTGGAGPAGGKRPGWLFLRRGKTRRVFAEPAGFSGERGGGGLTDGLPPPFVRRRGGFRKKPPLRAAAFRVEYCQIKGRGAGAIAYILHRAEDEGVLLSGPAVRGLLAGGSGDAALAYIAMLKNRDCADEGKLRAMLGWDGERLGRAMEVLAGQGLVARSGQAGQVPPPPDRREERPEYTRADMARALEGEEFAGLTGAVEGRLGKKLTTPDLAILLGLYDQVGLPADVVFLLVSFCVEQMARRSGPGRRPTLRQIEREGYRWARLGLMDQESAAAYIRRRQRVYQALPRLMRLLHLGDRDPSPTEERYLAAWVEMGFEDEAVELAYDKTVVRCKELKWSYMNSILCAWHKKGLHNLEQIQAGDQRPGAARRREPEESAGEAARAEMARMER